MIRATARPAARACAPTRSTKLPPSEKPTSRSGRPPRAACSAPVAPTTSGSRQEWNSSRLRWCVSPWSRRFSRRTSKPRSNSCWPSESTYSDSALPSQPCSSTTGDPRRWPGEEWKHCRRTPPPQSRSISRCAATSGAARRVIGARRKPVLASMDCRWRLRSQDGGRKPSSQDKPRRRSTRQRTRISTRLFALPARFHSPAVSSSVTGRIQGSEGRRIAHGGLDVQRAMGRVPDPGDQVGERQRHALRRRQRVIGGIADHIALGKRHLVRSQSVTVHRVALQTESAGEGADPDDAAHVIGHQPAQHLADDREPRAAERVGSVRHVKHERLGSWP